MARRARVAAMVGAAALAASLLPWSGALAQDPGLTPVPSPVSASASGAPSDGAWPGTELPGAQAITATADRFVAVGSDGTFPGRAQAWTSSDGVAWEPASISEAPEGSMMTDVVATDGGLVAVGTLTSEGAAGPDEVAAWHSADGTIWESARVRRPATENLAVGIASVADGPAGTIALASFFAQDTGPARLYRTTDGRTWAPLRLPRRRDVLWNAVRAIPDGYLLIGNTYRGRPSTFRSADGEAWERVAEAPWLLDAAAAPEGPVVGIGRNDVVASPDLVTWSQVAKAPDPEPVPRADTPNIDWIGWDGLRYGFSSVAYAGCPEGVDECYQRSLLVSPDGTTWTESVGPDGLPGPDDATQIAGMATLGDTTVLLGGAGASPSIAWIMQD